MDKEKFDRIMKLHKEWLDSCGRSGERADLIKADLSKMDLRGIDLSGAYLCCANLESCNLRDAKLKDADLKAANLHNANLTYANMERAKLNHANLTNANLTSTILKCAEVIGADLTDTVLDETILTNADLGNTNLTSATIYGSIVLAGSKMPDKIVQVGPIGSFKNYITYYTNRDIIRCDCWAVEDGGSLEEFKKKVDKIYPKGSNDPDDLKYRKQYMAVIAMFESLKQ